MSSLKDKIPLVGSTVLLLSLCACDGSSGPPQTVLAASTPVDPRSLALSPGSEVGSGTCGEECCPLGWTKVVGTSAPEELNGTDRKTCVVADDGNDTVLAKPGTSLFAYGSSGDDSLNGAERRDGLIGGIGDDKLKGFASADFLDGAEGNDSLAGGAGPDLILGGAGKDRAEGGAGADRIFLGAGNDEADGGAGRDRVYGGPGNDVLFGGDGADRLRGGPGVDSLSGGDGPDALAGGIGDDTLRGGPGADTLHGGPGIDIVDGGGGDDIIRITSPCEVGRSEIIDGGKGTDTLYTHLTLFELKRRGVSVSGIEKVVLIDTPPSSDICAYEDMDDGYVEVIARVAEQNTFWRTDSGDFPLDGRNRAEASAGLMRHYSLAVEKVVSSDVVSIDEGDELLLLRQGGSADSMTAVAGTSSSAAARTR